MIDVAPAHPPRPSIDESTMVLGLHRIIPMAYAQIDMRDIWSARMERIAANPRDAAAMFDLAMILQSRGRAVDALAVLRDAVALQKDFCVVHGDGSGVKILAIVTPGDFMANTPIDFLLKGSNAVLWLHHVDEATQSLDNLPDHDVVFQAIGEANHHGPILDRVAELLPQLDRPVMNRKPELIAGLTRDFVSDLFADEPSILVPPTCRVDRAALAAVAAGEARLVDHAAGIDFPVIVRPFGTHAGAGLECVRGPVELAAYLATDASDRLYVAPYIDYRGADGLFNKQRIVLIDGRPFASHLALSDHWKVHYLSANMAEDAQKRAVEADWMERFDEDFALRHAAAFEALHRRIGLDYFGVDSAELPDGRLLVFELDVAMVVHDLDDEETFPYKKVAMRKLFAAFVAAAEKMARAPLTDAA